MARPCRHSTSGSGAISLCGAGCASSPGSRPTWTTMPRRSPSGRDGSARPLAGATSSASSCRPGSAAASSSRADYSADDWGTPGTSAMSIVVPEGRRCVCGGRGCLEAEASGTAIAALTGQPGRRGPSGHRRAHRDPGRSRHCLGGQPARSPLGRRERLGGPRVRRAVLRRRRSVRWTCGVGLDYARGARVIAGGLGDRGPLIGAGRVGWRGTEVSERRGGTAGGQRWAYRKPCGGRTGSDEIPSVAPPRPLGRDVVVVLLAVAAHPSVWWAGLAAVGRLARTGWWRRRPFLPVPGESYWAFRLVTAFGGTGSETPLTGRDVVAYLQWCRRTHPRRG